MLKSLSGLHRVYKVFLVIYSTCNKVSATNESFVLNRASLDVFKQKLMGRILCNTFACEHSISVFQKIRTDICYTFVVGLKTGQHLLQNLVLLLVIDEATGNQQKQTTPTNSFVRKYQHMPELVQQLNLGYILIYLGSNLINFALNSAKNTSLPSFFFHNLCPNCSFIL